MIGLKKSVRIQILQCHIQVQCLGTASPKMRHHSETYVPVEGRRSSRNNRVIGTFTERIAVLESAQRVLEAMKESGHFNEIDVDSLSTTIVGFLRDSSSCLHGICSYARGKANSKTATPGERAWRILVNRQLVHRNDGELDATIYHEFLHAILGSKENHGPVFQSYEALWPFDQN